MRNQASLLAVIVVLLSGCANMATLNRETLLPTTANSTGADKYRSRGKAIHLDIKQRLVMSRPYSTNPDVFCAEPSPDALSAVASAVGAGASVATKGSASIAQAFTEGAAMVGLRTQSITLMRDQMFRVCEAYYNGQLTRYQVMTLLTRGQDLTAAIVAIEQLTGTVAARQAGIAGSSNATASATLLANTEALSKIREMETRAEEAVKTAEGEREAAKKVLEDLEGEPAFSNVGDPEHTNAVTKRDKAFEDLKTKEQLLDLRKKQEEDVTKARAALETQQDSSATMASAGATMNTEFGGGLSAVADASSKEAVSKAVQAIATAVLSKTYIIQECMAILSSTAASAPEIGRDLRAACATAIVEVMRKDVRAASETQNQAALGLQESLRFFSVP